MFWCNGYPFRLALLHFPLLRHWTFGNCKNSGVLARLMRAPPLRLVVYTCITGADPGFFFRRGCTRLLLYYFNTNKPHSLFFFLQNTSCIRKPQVISGGVRTPCTLPLDPPLYNTPQRSRRFAVIGLFNAFLLLLPDATTLPLPVVSGFVYSVAFLHNIH